MRVSTAFKRLLRLPGSSVADVSFGAEGVIVTVRLRRRRRLCVGWGRPAASSRSTASRTHTQISHRAGRPDRGVD